MNTLPLVFEMETSDPDDFLTLLWLADHPYVQLLGVLVTPGSWQQCQWVRWGLNQCRRQDVPIGVLHDLSWWDSESGKKDRVSGFHPKAFGCAAEQEELGAIFLGETLLASLLQTSPDLTILVGSAPKNLGKMFSHCPQIPIKRWVQQGGFAGDNLVAQPLEKFKGRLTCPSFNPGGAPRETLAMLASPRFEQRLFVSKNVCHGVIWDEHMQRDFQQRQASSASPRQGLALMMQGLDFYLHDQGTGKAMHDLVAAACSVDDRVCVFREVEIYREQGEWGARALPGSSTRISIGFDRDRFLDVLCSHST